MRRRPIGEDVRLVTGLSPGLHRVRADLGQVEQVVINRAVSARDAMPTGGTLTIEVSDAELCAEDVALCPRCPPGQYARLAATDTGT